ncbi:glycosyltransferase family A protein [Chitinimonas lacunae]|uniref:Glycosyltransferase family A protein n=1 Tax=Chitinimonas lacunae TaxID=1963018 RepID=A0ABV8MT15_9NEIS
MNPQEQFTVAVAICTLIRPSLRRAVESVYAQDVEGRIHLIIGIDKLMGDMALLDQLIAEAPPHVHVTVINPGYSTSARHGGMYGNFFGGVLPTVLMYLANSRYLAWLDDDNWFAPNHLSSLLKVIPGKAWAYSYRWYAHPTENTGVCIDQWESVGPGNGVFKEKFGGFCDPSTLMYDKAAVHMLFPLAALSLDTNGNTADRVLLSHLFQEQYPCACSGEATSYYTIDPSDVNHGIRLKWMSTQVADLPEWKDDPNKLLSRSVIEKGGQAVDSL